MAENRDLTALTTVTAESVNYQSTGISMLSSSMCWMLTTAGYRRTELEQGALLRRAFDEHRSRVMVTRRDRDLVSQRRAPYLFACNGYSRLIWAEAFCEQVSDFFQLDEDDPSPDEPVHLLTITDVG